MNEETYEDINIKPISLDNAGHLNIEQVEEGGTPIRLHSSGGGYILPTATKHRLGGIKVGDNLTITDDGVLSATGGGSSKQPILLDITDFMKTLFINYYDNGIEYTEETISQELQEQFNIAYEALKEDITTPVFFADEDVPEYFRVTNIQLGEYVDNAFLTAWYHWGEPGYDSTPPHLALISIGIQGGIIYGAVKKLDLIEGQPPID